MVRLIKHKLVSSDSRTSLAFLISTDQRTGVASERKQSSLAVTEQVFVVGAFCCVSVVSVETNTVCVIVHLKM